MFPWWWMIVLIFQELWHSGDPSFQHWHASVWIWPFEYTISFLQPPEWSLVLEFYCLTSLAHLSTNFHSYKMTLKIFHRSCRSFCWHFSLNKALCEGLGKMLLRMFRSSARGVVSSLLAFFNWWFWAQSSSSNQRALASLQSRMRHQH